jgi:hypothetical protein
LGYFVLKMIILPRQARDRHMENSKKNGVLRRRALMIVNFEHAFTQWASVEFGGGAAAGAGK